jgi:pimeloyl-ACP methyl ester carboxylesterase
MDRRIVALIMLLTALVANSVVTGEPPKNEAAHSSSKGLAGKWQGSLQLGPGVALRLVFEIATTSAGELRGSMLSIDQGNTRSSITKISTTGEKVRFELKQIGATFEGTMNAGGDQLDGQWKQSLLTLPITMKRISIGPGPIRPEEPKEPYPYVVEEVVAPNATDGVHLAGTLTLPKSPGPHPAAVLITGSGPQDRDEAVMGHRPFLVLAHYLTRQGYAVLRCDDRGVGRSTGDFAKADEDDFVSDALSAVAYLRTRPEIDSKRLGLIGHSEGTIVAAQSALQSPEIAFIVMLAGPGVPMEALLARQGHEIAVSKGWDQALLAAYDEQTRETLRLVKEHDDPAVLASQLRDLYRRETAKLTDEQRRVSGWSEGTMELQIRFWQSAWIRQLVSYDPRPTLAKIRCRVLALNGEQDIQVAAKDNLDAIRAAILGGGNSSVKTVELPGLNHLFQNCRKKSIEYGQLENSFDVSALSAIAEWLSAQGFGPRR